MKIRYDFWSCRAMLLFVLVGMLGSCEAFLEVPVPDTQLAGPTVFEDADTADAAMAGIYAKLRDGVLLTGSGRGLSVLLGQYADELDSYNQNSTEHQFYLMGLLPANTNVNGLWRDSYNLIYACNALMEGVEQSSGIGQEDQERLLGEALFLRAYIHFQLMQLFGEIPFVEQTDYRVNTIVPKRLQEELYPLLLAEVEAAAALLPVSYADPERIRPVRAVAVALAARMELYRGNWQAAETLADEAIGNAAYVWVDNIEDVFKKESTGTLWQLAPSNPGVPPAEGISFILTGTPANRALNQGLVAAFEPGDLRRSNWIGTLSNESGTWYYAFKYKKRIVEATSSEYAIQFRLEELYLIRAEARARQGNLGGARTDLDKIRLRAGLPLTSALTGQEVLEAILQERRVELFTEHGHRWFDLRRTGQLEAVLGNKPGWDATDRLWPLPEQELLLNPKLLPQNEGY